MFGRSKSQPEETRALSPESGTFPAVMLRTTATGEPVSAQTALRVPEVWACVRALSDAAASLPLRLYRRTEVGRTPASSGRTFDLLRQPAPTMTTGNLIGTLVVHLALYGKAWLVKYRDGDGVVAQLGVLSPERVFWQIKDGVPRYTVTTLDGQVREATPDDIVHLRGMSLDGYEGLSCVSQCADAIALCVAMQEHAGRFFRNDARPSGLLRVPAGPASQDQIEALRKAWEARHAGTDNAHRIAVVSGEIEFDAISLNPEQQQFAEQREQAVRAICRAFRIPTWMVSAADAGSLTYSNAETQNQAFVDWSLRPWLTVIEQAITADRDLCMGSLEAEFDFQHLLRGDQVARATYYQQGIAAGWLRPEDARRMEGLPPVAPGALQPRPAAVPARPATPEVPA